MKEYFNGFWDNYDLRIKIALCLMFYILGYTNSYWINYHVFSNCPETGCYYYDKSGAGVYGDCNWAKRQSINANGGEIGGDYLFLKNKDPIGSGLDTRGIIVELETPTTETTETTTTTTTTTTSTTTTTTEPKLFVPPEIAKKALNARTTDISIATYLDGFGECKDFYLELFQIKNRSKFTYKHTTIGEDYVIVKKAAPKDDTYDFIKDGDGFWLNRSIWKWNDSQCQGSILWVHK